jgi:hypothetical protein
MAIGPDFQHDRPREQNPAAPRGKGKGGGRGKFSRPSKGRGKGHGKRKGNGKGRGRGNFDRPPSSASSSAPLSFAGPSSAPAAPTPTFPRSTTSGSTQQNGPQVKRFRSEARGTTAVDEEAAMVEDTDVVMTTEDECLMVAVEKPLRTVSALHQSWVQIPGMRGLVCRRTRA